MWVCQVNEISEYAEMLLNVCDGFLESIYFPKKNDNYVQLDIHPNQK